MKNFFTFNKFITPSFITVLYWISIVFSILAGLGAIISSFSGYGTDSLFLYGLFIIIFGILSSRITCELILVVFNINKNLEKIAESKSTSTESSVE